MFHYPAVLLLQPLPDQLGDHLAADLLAVRIQPLNLKQQSAPLIKQNVSNVILTAFWTLACCFMMFAVILSDSGFSCSNVVIPMFLAVFELL